MCLAIPGLVLSISGDEPIKRVGQVKFGGITKEVSLAYVPEAKVGDYVIVHVGFAISTLDQAEANRVFEYLREMDELQELEVPSTEYRVPSTEYEVNST
jgi:hydrogenase expression/formation protein HypC